MRSAGARGLRWATPVVAVVLGFAAVGEAGGWREPAPGPIVLACRGADAAAACGGSLGRAGLADPSDQDLADATDDAWHDNPFVGRAIDSAVDAFWILVQDEGLADAVTFGALEPTGPEGFILRDVRIDDPIGGGAPLRIARVRVDDLDLAGLASRGAADRFSIALDGIDYAALLAVGTAMELPSLPALEGPASLSLGLRLTPPAGDPARRDLGLVVQVDDQFVLAFEARFLWPAAPAGPPELDVAEAESIVVEVRDFGFLRTFVERRAADLGIAPSEFATLFGEDLRHALGPLPAGSPSARLADLAGQALAAYHRPSRMRLSLRTTSPRPLAALLDAFASDGTAAELVVDAVHEPLP